MPGRADLGGALVVLLAACGSSYSSETPPPSSSTSSSSSSSSSSTSSSSSSSSSGAAPYDAGACRLDCGAAGFCDPFEREVPAGNGWTLVGTAEPDAFGLEEGACGKRLVADAPQNGATRVLQRQVSAGDAKKFVVELDLTVLELDSVGFTSNATASVIALSAGSFNAAASYLALGVTKGGLSYYLANPPSDISPPIPLVRGQTIHLVWSLFFGATHRYTISVDGAIAVERDSSVLSSSLPSQGTVAIGLASSNGAGRVKIAIDNLKLTTE